MTREKWVRSPQKAADRGSRSRRKGTFAGYRTPAKTLASTQAYRKHTKLHAPKGIGALYIRRKSPFSLRSPVDIKRWGRPRFSTLLALSAFVENTPSSGIDSRRVLYPNSLLLDIIAFLPKEIATFSLVAISGPHYAHHIISHSLQCLTKPHLRL